MPKSKRLSFSDNYCQGKAIALQGGLTIKKKQQKNTSGELYGSPDEILEVLHQVRASLKQLIVSAGADPTKTRETARHLELSNNLVWPVSRFLNATDIITASGEVLDRLKFEKV